MSDIVHLPAALRPHDVDGLVRIGPPNDGGYFLLERSLSSTAHLLSLGLSDDWRFEQEFAKASGASVTVYDHTVDLAFFARRRVGRIFKALQRPGQLPAARSRLTFGDYRNFFSPENRNHLRSKIGHPITSEISIGSAIDKIPRAESVFLKCDIEGWEWRSIHEIATRYARLSGFVVEFHDVDLHLQRLVDFVHSIPEFAIVDVQANNYGGVNPDGIPEVVELSFAPLQWLEPRRGATAHSAVAHDPSRPPLEIEYY